MPPKKAIHCLLGASVLVCGTEAPPALVLSSKPGPCLPSGNLPPQETGTLSLGQSSPPGEGRAQGADP